MGSMCGFSQALMSYIYICSVSRTSIKDIVATYSLAEKKLIEPFYSINLAKVGLRTSRTSKQTWEFVIPRNTAEKLVYIHAGMSHHKILQLNREQTKLYFCCKEENILFCPGSSSWMNSLLGSRSAAGVIGLYCVQQYCQHQIAVVGSLQQVNVAH